MYLSQFSQKDKVFNTEKGWVIDLVKILNKYNLSNVQRNMIKV